MVGQRPQPHVALDQSLVSQAGYAYRCDWGQQGLSDLAPHAQVVIIVDVLRFSTAVCAALESGGTVLPYPSSQLGAQEYASANQATLAGSRQLGQLSISPTDLLCMQPGTRMVLPSANGSALAYIGGNLGVPTVLAGCLRNATATAEAARRLAGPHGVIAVIAAGEQTSDHLMRPAVEDLIGAGAILAALDPSAAASPPRCSPEAAAARAAFVAARPDLHATIANSMTGRQLAEQRWDDDVAVASALDVSVVVPILVGNEFVAENVQST